jgi:hypothetical protein
MGFEKALLGPSAGFATDAGAKPVAAKQGRPDDATINAAFAVVIFLRAVAPGPKRPRDLFAFSTCRTRTKHT